MWMYVWLCVCFMSVANMVTLLTRESSGLYTVQSELHYKVTKEDKDAHFSCEVSYFVPGAVRTSESKGINITVHCKSMYDWEFLMKWNVIYSNSCSRDKLNNTAWMLGFLLSVALCWVPLHIPAYTSYLISLAMILSFHIVFSHSLWKKLNYLKLTTLFLRI